MRSGIPADVVIRSVVLIQKWFRRYRARLEKRRRVAWKVYQSVEYSGETSQNLLHRFFKDMLSNYLTIKQEKSKTSGKSALSTTGTAFYERLRQYYQMDHNEVDRERNFDNIEIELGYEGAHLKFPMSAVNVQEMIEKFKVGKQLHPKYLMHLLRDIEILLQSRPNIQKFSTSISKKVTVVGDLHGHLDDLLIIFDKNGLPDVTNPYVFNGDYVDRGPNSVEVISLVFACQVAWPTAVFLNRGNHEDPIMNISHGFESEIRRKYRRHMSYILELFGQVFSWLPLATIIDDRIFVTHGGISDTLDLKVVGKIDRHQVESVGSIQRFSSNEKNISKIEREQVEHLLWNDPENTPGCSTAENRSYGVCFGPDVTAKFLNRHQLTMLVRSHECFPGGYNYKHNRKTLTIFSASNYFNPKSNLGAYVKLDSNGVADIIQFDSSRAARESLSRRITSLEDDAIRALRSKIVASKSELVEAFQQLDPKETDSVTINDWCDAMKKTLKINLPWRMLRPHLVQKNDPYETVKYMTTFDKVEIQHGLEAVNATVAETIYKNRVFLEEIFRIMDTDKSGCISPQEFKECCQILGQVTQRQTPAEEVAEMTKTLDLNSDGKIDFNEFLESFRMVNL